MTEVFTYSLSGSRFENNPFYYHKHKITYLIKKKTNYDNNMSPYDKKTHYDKKSHYDIISKSIMKKPSRSYYARIST